MGRQVGIRAEPGEGIAEAGAGKGGERRLREQKGLAGGMPAGAVPRFREGSTASTPTMPPTQRGSRANTMIASAAAFISAP
jgi:hypothetical protein